MKLHSETFGYLRPADSQLGLMIASREAAARYADYLEGVLPEGADKTFIMRQLRTVAMWVNVCITRNDDGSPR